MKKIMVIFGTRPEAIKMAPLIHALQAHPDLQPIVCVTAQHRQMLDQILTLFNIKPDIDLDLMRPNQTLAELSARVLGKLSPIIAEHQPDAILVQGDTTTTFCAALAAFYQNIPVGHVEAGLRTGDIRSPFPEEMNRVLTTKLAQWHFAPTSYNRETLLLEGIDEKVVFITGNPVIDALLWVKNNVLTSGNDKALGHLTEPISRPYILVTGHRRESFGAGFEAICQALKQIAQNHSEIDIIYPVHLNPHVQEPVSRILGNISNIHLIAPQDYTDFITLMDKSLFILTDSGGVQEEAPSLGKPVLVMRDKTERVEALKAGVKLVGTNTAMIVAESERLLTDTDYFKSMAEAVNPYGDGTSAIKIVAILAEALKKI
jgi:UDP-N-acetylglucosamine 2-epimerase (non-hydrolysing)